MLVGDQGRDTASRGGGTGEEKYKAGKEGGTGDKVRDASERERPLKTREEKAAFGRLTPQLVSLLFFVCMQRTIQLQRESTTWTRTNDKKTERRRIFVYCIGAEFV